MDGCVRAVGKCPVCQKSYQEAKIGKERVFICPDHRTMPRRVTVDQSGFGLKRRFRYSDKAGNAFATREAGEQYLDALRVAKARRDTWDPSEWDVVDCREFQFDAEWKKWTSAHEGKWGARHKRQVESARKLYIAPAWGKLDMRDIRNAHLIDLNTGLQKRVRSSRYRKLILSIACIFLNFLRKRGDVKQLIEKPAVEIPDREFYALTSEQQEQIIAHAPARYRQIMRLQARVGVRPCEICAVQPRHFVGGFIFFAQSIDDDGNIRLKTKKGQVIRKPVPVDMAAELAAQTRGKFPTDFVFRNRIGKPFRPGVLSRAWKKAAGKAGIRGVTFNEGTRHSFATRLWREEEELARKRTAEGTAHRSVETTFRNYVATEVFDFNRQSATNTSQTTGNQAVTGELKFTAPNSSIKS
jgi:integrase